MADRIYRNSRGRYDRDFGGSRQEEQFEPDWRDEERSGGQMGEGWRDDGPSRSETTSRPYGRDRSAPRDWGRDPSYPSDREGGASYRSRRYRAEQPGFGSFTGNEFGGRDFSTPRFTNQGSYPGGYGAGSRLAANHGEWHDYGSTPSRENRDYRGTWGRNDDDRNWLDRATDTVAGWFNDDDDDEYRGRGYRGHGPSGYSRSDERIMEDACDALTEDWGVDARQISVTVKDGEITLDGTVPSRHQKRQAEDCVEDLSGVRHVQNNLRVQESSAWDRNNRGDGPSLGDPTST